MGRILEKLLRMPAGKQDEFQHKWAFILMMTLKCFKTIKNSNDEMALVNIKAQKFEYLQNWTFQFDDFFLFLSLFRF